MKVLCTEANGFGAVFTRELDFPRFSQSQLLEVIEESESMKLWHSFILERGAHRDQRGIDYNPFPGSALAIGCWSLLEDANWKLV